VAPELAMKFKTPFPWAWPVAIVALVACIWMLFALLTRGRNYSLGQEIIYDLQHHIKKGDDLKSVSKYLDNKDKNKVLVGRKYQANISGIVSDSRIPAQQHVSKGAVSALVMLVPNVQNHPFGSTSLLIAFFFDKDKKLIGHTVQNTGITL
jgi:hypothetical protein